MALTRLPGSKWWVETDDVTSEITATYNKAQITADIAAINTTLATLPNATQTANDVAAIITRVSGAAWASDLMERRLALINSMYQAYQGEPIPLQVSELTVRRDALIALRERLV